MKRTIAVATGTRADYGLLRWVMQGIVDDAALELQIIATGTHLSPEFGLTYRDIEADGFSIDAKVEMLTSSDTAIGLSQSMGLGMIGFANALEQLQPDLLLVLGDRYEIFALVSAALAARVPVAHLHGGELSAGAIDDALRHSITKMSHLHFVAADAYAHRVVQLGERPDRVFTVGGLGVDAIKRIELMPRNDLARSLSIEWRRKNLLITYHPTTLGSTSATGELQQLLDALSQCKDTTLIFTMPNADTGSRALFTELQAFSSEHENAHVFVNLGQLRYLSCLAQVDAVLGNSSSGLAEAPSFGIATINVGDRQSGRLKAASVLDCEPVSEQITAAIAEIYTDKFQQRLQHVENPYGQGNASERIVTQLRAQDLQGIVRKSFHDMPAVSRGEKLK